MARRKVGRLAGLLALSYMTLAQTPGHRWSTYTNVRFQYSICYPADILEPQPEAANGDGRKFLGGHGAQLIVYGQNNVLGESLRQELATTVARLVGSDGRVTYKLVRSDSFLVSGRKGSMVFYAKTLYSHQQFKAFELSYGNAEAQEYKPVAARLSACFTDLSR